MAFRSWRIVCCGKYLGVYADLEGEIRSEDMEDVSISLVPV